jgi:dihydrodipicolinate synthase/N-acetylneuraminate lyase
MVSPFTTDHGIDQPAVERLVRRLLDASVAGLFLLGTTGEGISMSQRQRHALVSAATRAAGGRAALYAGVSGNSLEEAIEAAKAYEQLGIDAVAAHAPFYFPLNDDEVQVYFERLADASPLPLVLYNIPSTTRISLSLDVVERLRHHPNIVALKDSAADAQRLTDLLRRTGGRDGFPVLLGSSPLFTQGLKLGAVGLVPSGAHLVPEQYQAMYEAAMRDDWTTVQRLQVETDAACARYARGRSLGQSLAALKALLEQQGLCTRVVLPPLQTCQEPATVPVVEVG